MPVLLAAALAVLVGMTGLAVDFGFATIERRQLQNAADAAAVSGAINLVRYSRDKVTPNAEVQTVVGRNTTADQIACTYVSPTDPATPSCAGAPAATSDGVRVAVGNTRPTFFMNVLGVPAMSVSAESTARISAWTNDAPYDDRNSLFIVRGYHTRLAEEGNKTLSILEGTAPNSSDRPGPGPWTVNPAAIGKEFVIHDPHVAKCGMDSERWKGLNASSGQITLPRLLTSATGDKAGPTNTAVNGIQGCAQGVDSSGVNNCVMILPIAVSSPEKDKLWCVRWLPFLVRQPDKDPNTHYGTLIGNYTVREETNTLLAPWTHETKASITSIRTIK